ncbi:MAG: pheA [Clostridia bacterium]|jgi:chorismate mutase/prephenate dehydratase|nr:pheA [Clostridia bacterium]
MGEEGPYYNIGENLKISIENLYEHNKHVLKAIEEGMNDRAKVNPIVGYQGVAGSFGQEAAMTYFKENDATLVAHEEFEDVFEALEKGTIDYGVVPIENSSAGDVLEIYDLMLKHNAYIIGEEIIKVEHNLLGIKGAKIEALTEVYSHPQALSQCKGFLRAHRYIEEKPYLNTAMASQFVAEAKDRTKASIGSNRAAEAYGLEILKSNIHFNDTNCTRFIVLAKNMAISKKCDKISVVFTTSHTSGALYNILGHFAYNGLNLLKIQSRPLQEKTWHYFFFVDLEGNLQDANVLIGLGKLEEQSKYLKILGNYKQA